VRPQFWGHGSATELGREGLRYAFDVLGIHAVISCTDHDNLRSRAVIERLGMTYSGMLDFLAGGPTLAVYIQLRA
jgi:RimJ/RimL family protein N-acetyltransferase